MEQMVGTIVLLRQHAADHDHVGPVKVAVRQLFDVAIDQPYGPLTGQERGHRDQPQRRGRVLSTRDGAGFTVIPE